MVNIIYWFYFIYSDLFWFILFPFFFYFWFSYFVFNSIFIVSIRLYTGTWGTLTISLNHPERYMEFPLPLHLVFPSSRIQRIWASNSFLAKRLLLITRDLFFPLYKNRSSSFLPSTWPLPPYFLFYIFFFSTTDLTYYLLSTLILFYRLLHCLYLLHPIIPSLSLISTCPHFIINQSIQPPK